MTDPVTCQFNHMTWNCHESTVIEKRNKVNDNRFK